MRCFSVATGAELGKVTVVSVQPVRADSTITVMLAVSSGSSRRFCTTLSPALDPDESNVGVLGDLTHDGPCGDEELDERGAPDLQVAAGIV
mmetsp:Transcript_133358/g.243026  ORF Transcript_133358/g.243026 Transcript_133358/m.243026 type:complete len:91 (-) Transcript_133358:412-684(-)